MKNYGYEEFFDMDFLKLLLKMRLPYKKSLCRCIIYQNRIFAS